MIDAATSPCFTLRRDGGLVQVSLLDILEGRGEGAWFAGPTPFREVASLLGATCLTADALEGESFNVIHVGLAEVAARAAANIRANPGRFRLDGDGFRYMQVRPLEEARNVIGTAGVDAKLHPNFGGSKAAKSGKERFAFGQRLLASKDGMCPACAFTGLHFLAKFAPGSGGEVSGLHKSGTLCFLICPSLRDTIVQNALGWRVAHETPSAAPLWATLSTSAPKDPWADEEYIHAVQTGRDFPLSAFSIRHIRSLTQWAVWLQWGTEPGTCSVCGMPAEQLVTGLEVPKKVLPPEGFVEEVEEEPEVEVLEDEYGDEIPVESPDEEEGDDDVKAGPRKKGSTLYIFGKLRWPKRNVVKGGQSMKVTALVPSPFTLTVTPAKGDPSTPVVRTGMLLSVAAAVLDPKGDGPYVIPLALARDREAGVRPSDSKRSVLVASILNSEHGSAHSFDHVVHLPVQGCDHRVIAAQCQMLHQRLEAWAKALLDAVTAAAKYDGSHRMKSRQRQRSVEWTPVADNFVQYLGATEEGQDAIVQWEKYLRHEALRVFRSVTRDLFQDPGRVVKVNGAEELVIRNTIAAYERLRIGPPVR